MWLWCQCLFASLMLLGCAPQGHCTPTHSKQCVWNTENLTWYSAVLLGGERDESGFDKIIPWDSSINSASGREGEREGRNEEKKYFACHCGFPVSLFWYLPPNLEASFTFCSLESCAPSEGIITESVLKLPDGRFLPLSSLSHLLFALLVWPSEVITISTHLGSDQHFKQHNVYYFSKGFLTHSSCASIDLSWEYELSMIIFQTAGSVYCL